MDFSIAIRATLAPEPLWNKRYSIQQAKPERLSLTNEALKNRS